MLRISLAILKITGILFLVLLLLLIGILLALLFVPLRYRLTVKNTEQETSGGVKITWLLHFFSFHAAFDLKKKEGGMEIRILGIRPETVRTFFRDRKRKKQNRERQKRQKKQSNKQNNKQINKRDKELSKKQSGAKKAEDTIENNKEKYKEKDIEKYKGKNIEKNQNGTQKRSQPEKPPDHQESTQNSQQKQRNGKQNKVQFTKKGVIPDKKLLYKLKECCGRIKQIPEKAGKRILWIKRILKRPEQILQKISDIRQKLNDCNAGTVCRESWEKLKLLLHHYRARKGSGYIRFGTGEPALTGELTGILYLLLPVSWGNVSIEPQFTDTMLETELVIWGHIRIVHLLKTAWWAFRNKDLRRLIHILRKNSD